MPDIQPFHGIRPVKGKESEVIIQPETLSDEENKVWSKGRKHSFWYILHPEISAEPSGGKSYKERIFREMRSRFDASMDQGMLRPDQRPAFYLYREERPYGSHTGIWCRVRIDDYLNNIIKRHEHTRAQREKLIVQYLDATGMDMNPTVITYPENIGIRELLNQCMAKTPESSFKGPAGYDHQIWRIDDPKMLADLTRAFLDLPAAYIADGHHRAAAATSLGIEMRKKNLRHEGSEPYNFFSAVLFSEKEVRLFEFNRIVHDLGKHSAESLLKALKKHFTVDALNGEPYKPTELHEFGMVLEGRWYKLRALNKTWSAKDPVSRLDVSILQNKVLGPLLGIKDPRTDKRISFIGGNLGMKALQTEMERQKAVLGFSLYPTRIEQLMQVADSGEVMPPKSTWFEPKLPSGLITHLLH